MKVSKRLRFIVWFLHDLAKRYHRALFFGFIGGLIVSISIGRLAPIILSSFARSVERIAIIGEFSPSEVPLSIQKELSVGLTTLASDGSATPGIATSWIAEDGGKQFTFMLSEKTWHDGKPVKASQINYNISGVKLEALNDKTIRAILPEAFSPFPSLVSKPILQVGLKGMGAYKVERIKLKGGKLQTLRLAPAQNTALPKKHYHFYKTENMAVLAYKRGDVDRIEDVSSPDLLANWRQTTIRATVRYDRLVALYFNMKDPLLKDRNIRQALAFATPEFSEEKAFSPIQKTSWAYSDKVKQYSYDEAQARKLIESINFPDQFSELIISTFPQYISQAISISQSWNTLGIPAKIQIIHALDQNFQILLSAQDLPPDPDQYPFWHSKSQANITGYANLKIDKFLEDGRSQTDQEKRKKIYADFQKTLVEDIPAIFLYHPKSYTIIRTSSLGQ
jgi:peptide/nickel transport system substrate-binding protein